MRFKCDSISRRAELAIFMEGGGIIHTKNEKGHKICLYLAFFQLIGGGAEAEGHSPP